MSPHVTTCRPMSPNVATYCHMSPNVAKCRHVSPHVAKCRRMSLHVAPCRPMSPHVDRCRHIREAVTTSPAVSHDVASHHPPMSGGAWEDRQRCRAMSRNIADQCWGPPAMSLAMSHDVARHVARHRCGVEGAESEIIPYCSFSPFGSEH